jgi:sporulation protein YlmC with PRC-barrel domain
MVQPVFLFEENVMTRPFGVNTRSRLLLSALGLALSIPVGVAAADRETQATLSSAPSEQAQTTGRNVRASKLIGSEVRNPQGEKLGEIKDLIVDVGNDRVHYAVLSFGGVMGVGDKLFAYPVRSFSQTADKDELVLNVDKARLRSAPGFDKDRYPDWNTGRYREEVERFHGGTAATKPMPNQMLRRASELLGKNVDDRNGKDLGEIEDLVINMTNGTIPYAVLEFDRSWNLNDKLLPVPLRAIDASGRRDLVMNVDKAQLDTARSFDKNRWPDLNDQKYMAEVRQQLGTMAGSGAKAGSQSQSLQGYTGPDSAPVSPGAAGQGAATETERSGGASSGGGTSGAGGSREGSGSGTRAY